MKNHFTTLLAILVFSGNALCQAFVHPGGLHTQEDLDRMKEKVAEGVSPWIDGWNKLIEDPLAQNTFVASPRENMNLRQVMSRDAHAAYLNAIRWYISGDSSYADCAIRIFNDYSSTLNQIPSGGTTDIVGLGGIGISELAMAAEIMRISDRWEESDFNRFKHMMVNYLYPVCHDFLTNHNGRCIDYYWANWDANNIAALVAIGVLCDNQEIYDEGIEYYKNGAGTGSIKHAIPYIHGDLGQWQEAGRDQSHGLLGVGLLASVCQIAWNQGMDLYGYDDNRLLKGAEYVAKYNLWEDVPFTFYNNCQPANNKWPAINARGKYHDRPVYEMVYNHYIVRQGLSAPYTQKMAEIMRPEGGSKDHFGYGTLTFTLNPSELPVHPTPPAPTNVTAAAGVGIVRVKWEPSTGNTVTGYNVQRAASINGPYETIGSWEGNTSARYTDGDVINGTTYYYRVAGINLAGTGEYSMVSNDATPKETGELLAGWVKENIGHEGTGSSGYSDVAEGTYISSSSGTDLGGTADNFGYTYTKVKGDVTITTRLSSAWRQRKVGLMLRESLVPGAKAVSMTLGDGGGRFARMGTRDAEGSSMSFVLGNTYTWIPAWFRIERTGDAITAYESSNGADWFTVGSSTISMDSLVYVGFAVCSGSETSTTTATFDHVSVVSEGTTPPSTPANLTATVGNTQISLNWDSLPNASGYNVKRADTSGGPYTTVARGLTETSYTDTGLENGTTYYYVVTAANFAGESQNSAEVSIAPVLALPPVPAGVLAASVSDTQIDLLWEASLSAESYNVKRSETDGGPYTTIAGPTSTAHSDTGLIASTTYYYVISAINEIGETDNSNQVRAIPGRVNYWKFDETAGSTATDSWGNGDATLSAGATFTEGLLDNAVSLDGTDGHVTLREGVVSHLMDFSISTWVKLDEVENWTRIFDFGSGTGNFMFLTPSNGATGTLRYGIDNGTGQQQINTTSTLDAERWYHLALTQSGTTAILYLDGVEVGRNTNMTLNPSSLGNTTQNWIGKSQYPDPLLAGQVDDFRIYNTALDPSEVKSIFTDLDVPPVAPGSLFAGPGDNQITLKWASVLGAINYTIYRSDVSGGPYTQVGISSNNEYIDTDVLNDSSYYYVLTTTTSLGESAHSEEISGTPNGGRLGYWKFDEMEGTNAADSWGDNVGTLSSGAIFSEGLIDNAVSLNGSDGYIALPDKIVNYLTDFSITTWVKLDKVDNWARLFDFGSGTSNYMFITPKNGQNGRLRYAIRNGGGEQQINTSSILTTDRWYHLAVTQSGTTAILYLDGEEVGRNDNITLTPFSLGNTPQNWIGKSQWPDPLLAGQVDDFRIYSEALSASEVADMAFKYLPPVAPKNLLAVAGNNRVSLSWTASRGGNSYNVKRATDLGGPFEAIANVTDTSYTDTTAVNCENYFYTVATVNEVGESEDSSPSGPSLGSKLSGALIGTDGSWGNNPATTKAAAVDGDLATFFDSPDNTAWVGYDLGADGRSVITRVRYAPRSGFSHRMNGAHIQGANTPDFSDAETLFVIPRPAEWVMTEQFISNSGGYRYIRYLSPNGFGSIAELEFYGLDAQLPEFSSDNVVEGTYDSAFHYSTVASDMPEEFIAAGLPEGLSMDTCTGVISGVPKVAGTFPVAIIATNYYGSGTDTVTMVIKKNQTISFSSIPAKYIGDADFALNAVASSGLPVTYSSSDTTIATIVDGNNLHINVVGTCIITASQAGDSIYYPVGPVSQSFTVLPLDLKVLHKDGDHGKTSNKSIKPHLQIVSESEIEVAYEDLTVRYWFTPENYAGISTWIDYAQLGRDKVSMNYVSLSAPHEGAYGYIEYGFDASLGDLLPGTGSGSIRSRLANTDWSNLDESDDHSFQPNSSYAVNDHITLYRNGYLISGTEPETVTPELDVKVYSENKNANTGTNKIHTFLKLNNEGNVPIDYKDLSIRYWFSKDSEADLNYWIDYAELDKSNVSGQFVALDPAVDGADTYFEMTVDSTAGTLYPLSSTGNIHYRITKSNWSKFEESEDHSYLPKAPSAENSHITVYYKGELVYGMEPGAGNLRTGTREQSSDGNDQLQFSEFSVYPNPVADKLTVLLNSENAEDVQITLHNSIGKLLIAKKVSGNRHELDLSTIPQGVYIITLTSSGTSVFRKIVKE